MTASSPITMGDLVNGLKLTTSDGSELGIILKDGVYKIGSGEDSFNTVSISSDGLTITFGEISSPGPEFTSFTFNA